MKASVAFSIDALRQFEIVFANETVASPGYNIVITDIPYTARSHGF